MKEVFKKKKNVIGDNSGFSLIEIATALFVISVGLLGVLSLITQNIQAENVNKNKLIASQLAQEGLGLIRNQRDDNWLSTNSWDQEITPGTYIVDHTGKIESVSNIDNAGLQIDNDGYYVHDIAYDDSIFKRMITIESETTASTSVSCRVEWNERGRSIDYVADTVLYDWR
jgi:prepilin-type N-terminal cleavage/methylation domain-containing protein